MGNSIFEGAVRIRVTRYLTPYGQPRVDTTFGWAGYSAWVAFVLTIVDAVIYSCFFVFHNRAMQEIEQFENEEAHEAHEQAAPEKDDFEEQQA